MLEVIETGHVQVDWRSGEVMETRLRFEHDGLVVCNLERL